MVEVPIKITMEVKCPRYGHHVPYPQFCKSCTYYRYTTCANVVVCDIPDDYPSPKPKGESKQCPKCKSMNTINIVLDFWKCLDCGHRWDEGKI